MTGAAVVDDERMEAYVEPYPDEDWLSPFVLLVVAVVVGLLLNGDV